VVSRRRIHQHPRNAATRNSGKWWHFKNWNWTAIATVVIAIATIASVKISSLQWIAINGQLGEMGRQIAITEAQLRPRMSLTLELSGDVKDANGGKSLNGRIVTPVWKNSGSVPPDELVGWVHIRTFDGDTPFGSPNAFHLGREDAPLERLWVPSPNTYEQGGTMINEGDLQRVLGRTGQVIAWGYMQYRDPFPNAPVHHLSWCFKLSLVLTESGRKDWWLPYSPDCNRSD
jgi:hypothetical protein